MAHQCLKCGETYPDGSPQILKGCEGCKGTRFFYTDAPLGTPEREELAEQAEIDLERLALGKGARAAQEPRPRPTKGEVPLGRPGDWVAVRPNDLRGIVEDVVRRAGERKPVFRVGEAPQTLGDWVQGAAATDERVADEGASQDGDADLLEDLFAPEREAAWRDESGKTDDRGLTPIGAEPQRDPAVPKRAADVSGRMPDADESGRNPEGGASETDDGSSPDAEVVYKRSPRPIPRPVSLAGVAVDAQEDEALRGAALKARAALEPESPRAPRLTAASGVEESLYPEGQAPETVAVRDGGVYELDVKRLLEKSPLVVHRDGSYSLHLPSLMETLERKRGR